MRKIGKSVELIKTYLLNWFNKWKSYLFQKFLVHECSTSTLYSVPNSSFWINHVNGKFNIQTWQKLKLIHVLPRIVLKTPLPCHQDLIYLLFILLSTIITTKFCMFKVCHYAIYIENILDKENIWGDHLKMR